MGLGPDHPHYYGMNGRPLGILISTILTFGFVLVGYDQGVMSGVITAPSWLKTFPQVDNSPNLLGFTVAIYDLGCLSGAAAMLFFGDILGRKKSCMSGGTLVILGVIIQVTCFQSANVHGTLGQFMIGRYFTGMGNGINMASMPVLQAELSHAARGMLVCLECGLIATGTMLAYWLDYGVRNYDSSFVWRFPIAFQIVLSLVYTLGTAGLPESPRWLCKKDRIEDATYVMAAVNGEQTTSEGTVNDIRAIVDSINVENRAGSNMKVTDMLTGGPSQHWRRVLLGISSQFFQQLGGCNAVIYYVPILFEDSLGKTRNQGELLGGAVITIYAVFSLVSFFTVETVGRRKLFLWGSGGQAVSMLISFTCLIPGTPGPAKGATFGFFAYIAFFGATYLTVPWLYAAEINPLRIRARGAATANIVNWSINFLIVMVTPIMVANIKWGTYLFFSAVNFSALPVIYFFYPETAHRTLEEIDLIFAKGYFENMSYVRAGKELPSLTVEKMEELFQHYGLSDEITEKKIDAKNNVQVERNEDV